MVSYELHAASKRLDIDLNQLYIYIPIPTNQLDSITAEAETIQTKESFSVEYEFELWKIFLRNDNLLLNYPQCLIPNLNSLDSNSSTYYLYVSGTTICNRLFSLCNPTISPILVFLTFIIAFIFTALPLVFIFLYPSYYSPSALPNSSTPLFIAYVTYFIASSVINILLFPALLMILFVCVIDAYRKYLIFNILVE